MATKLTTNIILARPSAAPPSPACSHCGSPTDSMHSDLSLQQRAQERISELESQVRILTLRATSAVEKANEYEGELRRLSNARSPLLPSSRPDQNSSYQNIPTTVSPPASPPRSAATRLVRLLSTRSAPTTTSSSAATSAASAGPVSPAGVPGDAALREELEREQARRQAAESQAARKDSEIEELTAQLFQQANEMVAVERRARAKLETRIEVLEKRDSDKAKRLSLLEMRVQRSERIRALLVEPNSEDHGAAVTDDSRPQSSQST